MKQNTKTKNKTTSKSTKSVANIPCLAGICIGVAGAALGACVVGALTLTSVNNLANPVPTISRAKKVCAEFKGAEGITDYTQFTTPDSENYDILLTYTCAYNDNPHTSGIEFSEMFYDDGTAALKKAQDNLAKSQSEGNMKDVTILEDSDTYLKFYQAFPDEQNVYYVATYDDVTVSLYAPSTDIAERVLVDLGFPARSQASK